MLRMVPDRRSSRIQALAEFATHRYERYVVPDRVAADGKPNNAVQRTLEDSGR